MSKMRCEACNREFNTAEALKMHNSSKHYSENKSPAKIILFSSIAAILIASILFFALKPHNTNESITEKKSSDIQQVDVGFTDNYNPNTIEVKSGQPVEITLDGSVTGCYRAFSIPQLNIYKISDSPTDTVRFTPTKPGIYRFQCGMDMASGTLIVE